MHFIKSGHETRLNEIIDSPLYLEYKELEMIIHSNEFQQTKKSKDFKNSEAASQLNRFEQLSKQDNIKFALHTLNSSEYKTYASVNNSARLAEFKKLETYVNSQEFTDLKDFLEDKKRFFKSEEYKMQQEFAEIESSEDHKWFIQTRKHNPFGDIEKLIPSFDDDFDTQKLDSSRWITGYYWGKALLNDNYVLADEKQFFTDKNITSRDSTVHISTRQEACKGKVWDAERGFLPANFDFTSGIINTGHSFRQLYGRFEAKVKINATAGVYHAFWMMGEKLAPQITVFKTNAKSSKHFDCGTFAESGKGAPRKTASLIKGASLDKDFHIITLDWTPNKLVWKINGEVVNEQTADVPNQPMYLAFSSHVYDTKAGNLPVDMEIDWVRCYTFK